MHSILNFILDRNSTVIVLLVIDHAVLAEKSLLFIGTFFYLTKQYFYISSFATALFIVRGTPIL